MTSGQAIPWGKVLGGAKESNPDAIPQDTYILEVKDASTKKTAKGEQMLEFRSEIVEGMHRKRSIWGRLVVPGLGADKFEIRSGFLVRDLKALGISEAYLESGPSLEMIGQAIVGKTFRAEVERYEYPPQSEIWRNQLGRIKGAMVGTTNGDVQGASTAPPPPPPAGPSGLDEFKPPAPAAAPPQEQAPSSMPESPFRPQGQ